MRHLGQRCTILPNFWCGIVSVLSLGHLILFAFARLFGLFFETCLVPVTTGLPLATIIASKLLRTIAFCGVRRCFFLYLRNGRELGQWHAHHPFQQQVLVIRSGPKFIPIQKDLSHAFMGEQVVTADSKEDIVDGRYQQPGQNKLLLIQLVVSLVELLLILPDCSADSTDCPELCVLAPVEQF